MDRFSLFSTPLVVFSDVGSSALRAELAARLVAESTASAGVERSNAGAWHSPPDLGRRGESCFRALLDLIAEHVRVAFRELALRSGARVDGAHRLAVHGWGMVMRDGDYVTLHDHADSHFSLVYYADAGDADEDAHPRSGLIAFVDPRGSLGAVPGLDLYPSQFTVRPRDGSLVVFPGWLQHYVHVYRGTRPRVSLSCNVRMELVGATLPA